MVFFLTSERLNYKLRRLKTRITFCHSLHIQSCPCRNVSARIFRVTKTLDAKFKQWRPSTKVSTCAKFHDWTLGHHEEVTKWNTISVSFPTLSQTRLGDKSEKPPRCW